jgi:hypothetical protein
MKDLRPEEIELWIDDELRAVHDWDDRWRHGRYHVRYRIRSVEETLSFAPSEVAESIRAAALAAPQMIEHLAPGGGHVDIRKMIGQQCRQAMMYMELFVRTKRRLSLKPVGAPPPKDFKRVLKRMIKLDRSRWGDNERRLWSYIVFGAVVMLLGVPVDHNMLEVNDKLRQTSSGRAGRSVP